MSCTWYVHSHAVCMWKSWTFPLLWFLCERLQSFYEESNLIITTLVGSLKFEKWFFWTFELTIILFIIPQYKQKLNSNNVHLKSLMTTKHHLFIFHLIIILLRSLINNGCAPEYLHVSDLLEIYAPTRSLLSATQGFLAVPKSFTSTCTYGDRAFLVAAPKLWNSLPASIRITSSLDAFKRKTKTYLFHDAFYSSFDWTLHF